MFWLWNKKNSFPLCTLILRPGSDHRLLRGCHNCKLKRSPHYHTGKIYFFIKVMLKGALTCKKGLRHELKAKPNIVCAVWFESRNSRLLFTYWLVFLKMSDFFKIIVFKNSFRNMIRVSNILRTVCKGNQQMKLEDKTYKKDCIGWRQKAVFWQEHTIGLYIPRALGAFCNTFALH